MDVLHNPHSQIKVTSDPALADSDSLGPFLHFDTKQPDNDLP